MTNAATNAAIVVMISIFILVTFSIAIQLAKKECKEVIDYFFYKKKQFMDSLIGSNISHLN